MRKEWRKTRPFVLVCVGALFLFIVWFIWAIATDEPPHFIPINSTEGEYWITKGCPNGQGSVENVKLRGEGLAYCVEYKGLGVFGNEDKIAFFRITVGKTSFDLKPFLNKKVRIVKGKYTDSDKQCINSECIKIGGPYLVLDIKKIELVQEE